MKPNVRPLNDEAVLHLNAMLSELFTKFADTLTRDEEIFCCYVQKELRLYGADAKLLPRSSIAVESILRIRRQNARN